MKIDYYRMRRRARLTLTFVWRFVWAFVRCFASVLAEAAVVLIVMSAVWFPFATAAVVDFQAVVWEWAGYYLSYLPWWLGGFIGYPLLLLAKIHHGMIEGLVSLHSLSRFTLWLMGMFLPRAWANIPHMINDLTFAWARIIFGALVLYVELRLFWIVWFLLAKPWIYMYRADKRDHYASVQPVWEDDPRVRKYPKFLTPK